MNPFLDKLVKLLNSDVQSPLTSYALASEMQKPIFTTDEGLKTRIQPFASALGADFQVTKNTKN